MTDVNVKLGGGGREKLRRYHAELVAHHAADEVAAKAALVPGNFIEGEGVYLGRYTLQEPLTRTFNVFAAPEDLGQELNFNGIVNHIDNLRDWHGHDGRGYDSDARLKQDIAEGAYKGEWVMPPVEVLCGAFIGGEVAPSPSLLNHINTGAFKGTFNTSAGPDLDGRPVSYYWSSSTNADPAQYADAVNFLDDDRAPISSFSRFGAYHSCRLVRFVPAGGPV